MKKGLVIADSGPIFSLALIDELKILHKLFDEVRISNAVWEEITLNETSKFYKKIIGFFEPKVTRISGFNDLTFFMGMENPNH